MTQVEPVPVIASPDEAADLSAAMFAALMASAVALALLLRVLFLTADPPWQATVGVTWHDEGAWVHNARNRALFGVWRTDEWNPVFIAPVFTALEFLSFAAFGVGTWQARLVSVVAGTISVVLLGLGVRQVAGRRAGVMAAVLLATSYVYVMYDRAALMEASMAAFIVASWYFYARSARAPSWGLAAGAAAILAYLTKAAAVFYVGALGLEALLLLWLTARARVARNFRRRGTGTAPGLAETVSPADDRQSFVNWRTSNEARAALYVLAGLAASTVLAVVLFVGPYWREYQFYNWQVSVTRKPAYTLRAFLDRASWFPIVHDFFTRMWGVMLLACAAVVSGAVRWTRIGRAERLLLLWVLAGCAELLLHDVGNERRLVFLIPALTAFAGILLGRDRRLLHPAVGDVPRRTVLIASPAILFLFYVAVGAILRIAFLYQTRPAVRTAAAFALLMGASVVLTWPRAARWLSSQSWSVAGSCALVVVIAAGDVLQFAQWASVRTYENVTASRLLGQWLPPGTVVHGKLANGLALENQIRPLFVGRGFGNYTDRLTRDDARYLVTYIHPSIGYEGPVIRDVLAAYPGWKVLKTFDVSETAGGVDRAALIDKRPQ